MFNALQKDLNDKTRLIAIIYKKMRFWVILTCCFSLVTIIVNFFIFKSIKNSSLSDIHISGLISVSVSMIYISLFVNKKKLNRSILNFKKQYSEAMNISNTIVDNAEWAHYRGSEAVKKKADKVQNSVDAFYDIRNLIFFPYRTETSIMPKIFKLLTASYLLMQIQTIIILAYSIFETFGLR